MSTRTVVTHVSRRDFLRAASRVGAGALLAACQQSPAPAPKAAEAPKPTAEATKPAAAAQAPAQAAKPADAKPAVAAPAATTAPAAAAGKRGGTLNYAEAGDFNNFNPWSVTAVNAGMYNVAFSRLTWKDGTGKENPGLAESWEMAPDGLSFRAKLRQGVTWHDGKELTAADYVTQFGYTKDETLLKDAAIKKHQGLVSPIKDVKAPDTYTVELQFGSSVPYVTDVLDYWYAIRIDDPADPSFTKKPPVGTGAFKMAEWTPNQFARFTRNPDYYVRDQPPLGKEVRQALSYSLNRVEMA